MLFIGSTNTGINAGEEMGTSMIKRQWWFIYSVLFILRVINAVFIFVAFKGIVFI